MFVLKDFIKENLVSGVKNGSFAKEYANILAVNYLSKGMLGEVDIEEISAGIEATVEVATSINTDSPATEDATVKVASSTAKVDATLDVSTPTETATSTVIDKTDDIE